MSAMRWLNSMKLRKLMSSVISSIERASSAQKKTFEQQTPIGKSVRTVKAEDFFPDSVARKIFTGLKVFS